jgi:hypothetical protein
MRVVGRLICKQVANALIRDVRPRPWVSWLVSRSTLAFVRTMDQRQGGLWVGGTLSVYDSGVSFEPNGLNRALQEGKLTSELSWPEVLDIKVRRGVLTNIIELSHANGVQAFRCFAAQRVAADMTQARKEATA